MGQRKHMQIDVANALRNWRSENWDHCCTSDEGKSLSAAEAKAYLQSELEAGKAFLPMCSTIECPDFDYNGGGCPGHEPTPVMEMSAVISACGMYRYELRRRWNENKTYVNFVGLNPSIADAATDDHTIKKCISYARSWGFGGLIMTNLYAYRSTDPNALSTEMFPDGTENLRYLRRAVKDSEITVCAWGVHPKAAEKADLVKGYLRINGAQLHYLELANCGAPKHPARLRGDLKAVPFR